MVAEDSKANRSLSERLADIDLIEAALKKAVREALWRHKVAGNPVAVWRDGRVVWLSPDEIQAERGETDP